MMQPRQFTASLHSETFSMVVARNVICSMVAPILHNWDSPSTSQKLPPFFANSPFPYTRVGGCGSNLDLGSKLEPKWPHSGLGSLSFINTSLHCMFISRQFTASLHSETFSMVVARNVICSMVAPILHNWDSPSTSQKLPPFFANSPALLCAMVWHF